MYNHALFLFINKPSTLLKTVFAQTNAYVHIYKQTGNKAHLCVGMAQNKMARAQQNTDKQTTTKTEMRI